jgi:hypothetical protein
VPRHRVDNTHQIPHKFIMRGTHLRPEAPYFYSNLFEPPLLNTPRSISAELISSRLLSIGGSSRHEHEGGATPNFVALRRTLRPGEAGGSKHSKILLNSLSPPRSRAHLSLSLSLPLSFPRPSLTADNSLSLSLQPCPHEPSSQRRWISNQSPSPPSNSFTSF